MPFLLQFVISYAAALLIGSIALSKRASEIWTYVVTYGIIASPFAFGAAILARLLERLIGWPAMIVAVAAIELGMYLITPNKHNFVAGLRDAVFPYEFLFVAVWCFLTWQHRSAA